MTDLLNLFESDRIVRKLIKIASEFQARHPYPDYGILYWNAPSKSVIYVVGDGQEGSLSDLEMAFEQVPGVREVEISDEGGRPEGFIKVWSQ